MVVVEQLRISDDGQLLFVDVHVNEATYFENVYLKKITICTEEQVRESNPTGYNDYIFQEEIEGTDKKEIHWVFDSNSFNEKFTKRNLSHTLFFVYIECGGTPSEDTPCRLDEATTLAVTFDTNMLYQIVMQQVKQLNETCKIPKAFIDLILLWNGFKVSVETEHYIAAIDFWKKLFGSGHTMTTYGTFKPCGCHG